MSTPNTAALDAIIARLEAATGPDRELDAAIAIHLGHRVEWHIDPSNSDVRHPVQITSWGGEAVPEYTASRDALIPGEIDVYSWCVVGPRPSDGAWWASVACNKGAPATGSWASTEPLVRRMAALLARAAIAAVTRVER